jgi:hypothetical protein
VNWALPTLVGLDDGLRFARAIPMTRTGRSRLVAAVATLHACTGWSAPSTQDLERLDRDLTPVGAERAGNADGSIPAWDGGLTKPPSGWTAAAGYVDPFPDDQPLFTITVDNAAQYSAKLTAGQAALLAKYPEYRIRVYPTRRSAVLATSVTDRVRAQAANARLRGFGLQDTGGSTTPFPIPQSGLEVIWNHLLRYLGGGVIRAGHSFPVRSNGDYYKIGFRSTRIYAGNIDKPEGQPAVLCARLFHRARDPAWHGVSRA